MTLRLVGLMSVVLLLSLAAFGLLTAHYQDRVMEEVARTASTVGRATFRTFELAPPRGEDSRASRTPAAVSGTPVRAEAPDGAVLETHAFVALTTHRESKDGAPDRIRQEVRRLELTGPPGRVPRLVETDDETLDACGPEDPTLGACVPADAVHWVGDVRFVVDVDRITAEPDPVHGLVLKIPQRPLDAEGNGGVPGPSASPPVLHGRQAAWEVAIPVEDYEALFASLRRRSAFLFLGVFVVGTVLSAGLAARFTRPVRRLDGAIRSLSEGDLEARVEVEGKGEIARLASAFNEMTRKLRANRERERDLVRREKLSALGRLAAGVAHDVRNPLHSINLTLEHLSEAARPDDEHRSSEFDRSVAVIRDEIGRLDRLVANFLRFANGERGQHQVVSLADVLAETARLVRKEAEWRRVELSLAVDRGVRAVTGDPEALRSAILNLVLNAFDAMPAGGRLALRLAERDGHAIIEVEDTGQGVPEEDRERVFEFSYTTREGGSGLGLAMVHHWVVEEHGGRVSLDGAPGGGTRVRIELPFERALGAARTGDGTGERGDEA
jgi:signal transduction histidine kinase